jgi:hypothetical protein
MCAMSPRLLRPLATIDPDAIAWRTAVIAAGSFVDASVVNAVSRFVKGCRADGIWDAMKLVVVMAGPNTLTGALVPLKGAAPTAFNIGNALYNKTSGIKGDGSTFRLESNRFGNSDPQDNFHMATFVSEATLAGGAMMGDNETGVGLNQIVNGDAITTLFRNRNVTAETRSPGNLTGFLGSSRSTSASFSYRMAQTDYSATIASQTPDTGNIQVFARLGIVPALYSGRLSYYSIGESLSLSLLDARVSALMNALGVS